MKTRIYAAPAIKGLFVEKDKNIFGELWYELEARPSLHALQPIAVAENDMIVTMP